uniref:DUF1618 domain-containing protein n=1 Tax=Leersia perrieri TaxID=77586 RepID=A0A0D9XZT9_9ORYZ
MDAAALPGWVMLDVYVYRRDDVPFPSDNPTVARGDNSRGDAVGVWFGLDEPPRPSEIYFKWPAGKGDCWVCVLGADGDSVLFQMGYLTASGLMMFDYLVYQSGGGGGPALHRLPPLDGTTFEEAQSRVHAEGSYWVTNQYLRRIDCLDMGIVRRRASQEIAVAELEELQQLPSIFPANRGSSSLDLGNVMWDWESDTVIHMCFVDYYNGVLLCNVFDPSPELLYLEFPVKIPGLDRLRHGRSWPLVYQTIGLTRDHFKFVSVVRDDGLIEEDPAPGCGFTVTSWFLSTEPEGAEMTWVKEHCITSDRLWACHGFATLPRSPLQYPLLSLSMPNMFYFVLTQQGDRSLGYYYDDTWIVAIDMTCGKLSTTFRYIKAVEESTPEEVTERIGYKYWCFEPFLPTEFPSYFK